MVDLTSLGNFVVNGFVIGSVLTLTAVGLTLVYGILNLANFAHGDLITLGAYLAYFFVALIPVSELAGWTGGVILLLLAVVAADRLARPRIAGTPLEARVSTTPFLLDKEVRFILLLIAILAALYAGTRWPPGLDTATSVLLVLAVVTLPGLASAVRDGGVGDEGRLTFLVGAVGTVLILLLNMAVLPALVGEGLQPAWSGVLALVPLLTAVLMAHPLPEDDPVLLAGASLAALLTAWSFGSAHILGIALAVLLSAGFAMLLDVLVWRPMRTKGAGLLTLIIISIGLALALRNGIVMRFGVGIRNFPRVIRQATEVIPGTGITATPNQLLVIASSIVIIALVHLLLTRTKMGKAMRALSDNMELARVSGIDVDRVILYVWAIAAALAALSGILLAHIRTIHPNLGWFLLLPIFAAVILGGIGSAYGAMAGGFLIGIAMEVSPAVPIPYVFPDGIPIAYKVAVGFVILIVTLLIKPEGIAGRSTR